MTTITTDSSTSSGKGLSFLDLEVVLKATRALSGEIVLSRLLEELLRMVIENTEAQRGVFLLIEEDDLIVEADGEIEGGKIEVLQSAPLRNHLNIPRSVINYVKKSRACVVLDDAQKEGKFSLDPYLSSENVRSLLCMPIMNKGSFTVMLYLENNSAPGAFTVERMENLKAIAAQIAVSIDNTRLYESIEKKVDERTEQLLEKAELLTIAREVLEEANEEMARDIEQRKLMEEELRKLATTDYLTGLFIRRQLFELGEKEINRAQRNGDPLSLMMLDIDHFKSINDTYGHAIGDEVLKKFSMLFRDSLRNIDIVCRFGGEEFVAILPDTDTQTATDVAQRLRLNVETSIMPIEGKELKYTISIGLAVLREKDISINQLINRADEALYHAKRSGRNQVVVVP